MIRPTSMIWLGVIVFTGVAVFSVKHEVSALEDRLLASRRAAAQDRDAIHVLNAEWSFLNQPTRLADLARRHLPQLQPLTTTQFGDLARIETLAWNRTDPNAPQPEVPAQVLAGKPPLPGSGVARALASPPPAAAPTATAAAPATPPSAPAGVAKATVGGPPSRSAAPFGASTSQPFASGQDAFAPPLRIQPTPSPLGAAPGPPSGALASAAPFPGAGSSAAPPPRAP